MQDAELRSSLRRYLETAIEQDQKLKNVLSVFAKRVGSRSPFYGYFCAHMEQLAARELISENLLGSLQVSGDEPPTSKPAVQVDVSDIENRQVASRELAFGSLRKADDFEAQLVRTYNHEPDKWARKYRPSSFGAANVDDIWRSGGEPKFVRKEGGIYHLISDSVLHYVVPEPGLKLQDSYFRSEGLGHVFRCPNHEAEGSGGVLLVSPAIVEESGDRWIVIRKGELRERFGR